MGDVSNTVATFTAAIISRNNRKKALKKIDKVNRINRNIVNIGRTNVASLIPEYEVLGNVCVSGGTDDIRNELILQNCRQSVSMGIPTIVLHESNHYLEQEVRSRFQSLYYMRVINKAEPYYDPVYRLSDQDIANLIISASSEVHKIKPNGLGYIKAILKLCRVMGVTPYLRMIGSCPFSKAEKMTMLEESKGNLSADEAASICNDISIGESERTSLEWFFSMLCAESDILSWKSNLSRCTSMEECIKSNGILLMDVSSFIYSAQVGLLRAELERCINMGKTFRLIIDALTVSKHEELLNLIKNSSTVMAWTLSSRDINFMVGANSGISNWLALSHKTIILQNNLKAAEVISSELGEYDHIEVSQAHAGNTDYGKFGLHFGVNNNITTSNKRERVIKAEDITNLNEGEFFMLNNNASLSYGVL